MPRTQGGGVGRNCQDRTQDKSINCKNDPKYDCVLINTCAFAGNLNKSGFGLSKHYMLKRLSSWGTTWRRWGWRRVRWCGRRWREMWWRRLWGEVTERVVTMAWAAWTVEHPTVEQVVWRNWVRRLDCTMGMRLHFWMTLFIVGNSRHLRYCQCWGPSRRWTLGPLRLGRWGRTSTPS